MELMMLFILIWAILSIIDSLINGNPYGGKK
jgi:hypothetical protein